jgi:hypothetical protein
LDLHPPIDSVFLCSADGQGVHPQGRHRLHREAAGGGGPDARRDIGPRVFLRRRRPGRRRQLPVAEEAALVGTGGRRRLHVLTTGPDPRGNYIYLPTHTKITTNE